ncbi:MAG: GDP-mannose 4,6-dehydratase, partial [Verrucomicrobiota bacterium]|nr:GDP-mannose 4,6-dehydratase [Verrucomicrobiota bacterium]
VLPRFIASAKRGEPIKIFGSGEQTRCFCYVTDTVEALVRLMNREAAKGEVFNIGSTEEISMNQLARMTIELLGSSSKVVHIPYEVAYAPGFEDMLRRKPSVEKLARITGFKPDTGLEEIIRKTAANF